ncbi:hypothetical protein BDV18DRAFT_50137 [Aspergillus unguis]
MSRFMWWSFPVMFLEAWNSSDSDVRLQITLRTTCIVCSVFQEANQRRYSESIRCVSFATCASTSGYFHCGHVTCRKHENRRDVTRCFMCYDDHSRNVNHQEAWCDIHGKRCIHSSRFMVASRRPPEDI